MKGLSFILILLLTGILNPYAQAPYELSKERELIFYSTGVVALGAGLVLRSTIDHFDFTNPVIYNNEDVNSFDRPATENASRSAFKASNILNYCAFALPAVLALDKRINKDLMTIAVLWSETILISGGLTSITKYGIQRPRPYMYRPTDYYHVKTSASAQASFVSGHTSLMAASTFFIASVYSAYHPNGKLIPYIWVSAAVLPAVTAYLRVEAGVHFPTDVIAGYALGAVVGIAVPALHRSKERKVELSPNLNGVSLRIKL